jgi:uncharacterized repeat protein (TIGR01451 family)
MRWITRRVTAVSLAAVILGAVAAPRVFDSATSRGMSASRVDRPGVEKAQWGQLPLRFEANLGQTDPRVRFLSRGPGYTLFVTGDETVLSIGHRAAASAGTPPVRMRFAGARTEPRITPGRELPGRSHYFTGGDRSRWRTGVPAYERVTLEQIYDGVDLVFHGSQQQLEYDFVVAPGADPGQIALKIDGATGLRLDDGGNLVLRTGDVDLVQHKPVVYQDRGSVREPVDGAYVLGEGGEVRFALGAYDSTRPLVIDPVVSLAFSSFLGGSSTEISLNGGIAVDRDGSVYVAGDTSSTNFPLVGAIQTDRPSLDIFVTKIAADGSHIVYSTYIGGNAQEEAHDIAVNDSGELWVTGFTDSVDNAATPAVNEGFPTFNAFQPAFGGGIGDAIVLKLNSTGDALVFSSHLGGGCVPGCGINRTYERAHAMTLDEAGNAFITGFTGSPFGFATAGAFQTVMGGPSDAWVAKITAAGTKERLTYLGGRGNADAGYGIAVDRDGFVYVTGWTVSVDNPATPIYEGFPLLNAFQPTPGSFSPGFSDAFVTKLAPDLSGLVYSSYLGGSSHENGSLIFNGRAGGIAVDSEGHAWVAGHTSSLNFPQVNPLRPRSGGSELFITKVAPDGRSLLFSTYYGGPSNDFAQDLTMDARGNLYIAAQAAQSFPVVNGLTPIPASNINVGAGFDAVAMKLLPSGAVEWATYIGGHKNDFGMSIAADDAGDTYLMGVTYSPNFPLQSPFQAVCGGCDGSIFGTNDAFVAKLVVPNTAPVSAADGYSVAEDGTLNILAPGVLGNDTDADGNALTAELVSGPTAGALVLNANGSFDYTPGPNFNGAVTFTYRADDGRAFGEVAVVTIAVIPVNDPPSADSESLTIEHETPTPILLMGGDPDGDPLTFTITDAPDNGVLTGVAPDVTYTSNGGFAGADQFTFTVSDGTADASATVTLAVNGPNVAAGYTLRTHARDVSTLGGGEALAANLATGNLYVRSRAVPNGAPAQFAEVPPNGSRTILATLPQMQNSPGTGIALDPLVPGGIVAANENFRISPRISRVDIASGAETTILASPWVLNPLGNGRGAQQYATDPANPQLLYVWDATTSKLFRLNRTTAALDELLALDQDAPEGDHATSGNDVAFDPMTGTILLSDGPSRSILEIDPRSSPVTVRAIYSDLPAAPTAIALDVPTRRLFVYLGAVYAGPRAGGALSLVASGIGLFDMTIGRASSGTGRSLYAMDFFRDRIYEIRSLNSPPVAVDDTATTDEDVAVDLTPLANDTDANGDALSIAIVTGPAHGTLALLAGGIVRYTPAANRSGTDSFSYRASDGALESAVASVTITVNPINDLPSAEAGGPYTVLEGGSVLLAGSGADVESATLTFDWDLDNDGVFESPGATPTFSAATIAGPASRTVTLRVTDGDGGRTIATAIITIENVAPSALPDSYTVDEDATLAVPAPGVLGNDRDIGALTAMLVLPPSNGGLTLNPDGSFSYTPNANFNGSDAFSYKASDGVAESGPVTVALTINSINDAPVARDDAATVAQRGGPRTIRVLANDSSAPEVGETLTVIGVTQPANGTAMVSADGLTVIYANARRFTGIDRFTYTIGDGNGGTATATVVVTVLRGNGGDARADLRVRMDATPAPVKVGQELTYRISVENKGPAEATDVMLTHAWPLEAALVSVVADQGSCAAGRPIVCALGDLPDGATAHVTVVVTPTRATDRIGGNPIQLRSSASATANEPDGNTNNNSATTKTKVLPLRAKLTLQVIDSPDPVRVGALLTYRARVTNTGPDAARHVQLDHLIVGDVLYSSVTPSQGTCGGQTHSVVRLQPRRPLLPGSKTTCELGTIQLRSTAEVTFVVTPTTQGTLRSFTDFRSPDAVRGTQLEEFLQQKRTTTQVNRR